MFEHLTPAQQKIAAEILSVTIQLSNAELHHEKVKSDPAQNVASGALVYQFRRTWEAMLGDMQAKSRNDLLEVLHATMS